MSLYVTKSLITSEDIDHGIGKTEQIRNGEPYSLTKLNASELGAALVLDTELELKNVDVEALSTRTVIIRDTGAIYSYDELDNMWKSYNAYIIAIDAVEDLKDVVAGVSNVYVNETGLIYERNGTSWVASPHGVYVVRTAADIETTTPRGVTTVITQDTAEIWVYRAGVDDKWTKLTGGLQGTALIEYIPEIDVVHSYDELPSKPKSINDKIYNTVFIDDPVIGGLFIWNEGQKWTNDGATVLNGWVRQFEGDINIKWFQPQVLIDNSTGTTISTYIFTMDKLRALFTFASVYFPYGTYILRPPQGLDKYEALCEVDFTINSDGAYITLENVSIEFRGKVGASGLVLKSLTPGDTEVDCIATDIQPENEKFNRVLIEDLRDNSFSPHTAASKQRQFNRALNRVFNGGASGDLVTLLTPLTGSYDILTPTTSRVQITPIKSIVVRLNNITVAINNGSALEFGIKFTRCADTVLDTCRFQNAVGTNNTLLSFVDCFNTELTKTLVLGAETGGTAVSLSGCDNTIINSSIFYGKDVALHVGAQHKLCNQTGVTQSLLLSSMARGKYSLLLTDAVQGMSVESSQLVGSTTIYGGTFKLRDSILLVPDNIKMDKLVSGSIAIENNTFIARERQLGLRLLSFYNPTAPLEGKVANIRAALVFNITNNSFVFPDSTVTYTGIFEAASGLCKGATGARYKHTINYYDNVIAGGVIGSLNTQLDLYGQFKQVNVNPTPALEAVVPPGNTVRTATWHSLTDAGDVLFGALKYYKDLGISYTDPSVIPPEDNVTPISPTPNPDASS